MNLHISPGNEFLLANRTTERLLSGVDFYVVPVGCSLRKLFSTVHAHVGFLAGVRSHVRSEQIFGGEFPRANGTSIGSVTGMNSHVLLQFALARNPSATNITDYGEVEAHLLVLTRITQFKATFVEIVLFADFALKFRRRFTGERFMMDGIDVRIQTPRRPELFAAELALVEFLPTVKVVQGCRSFFEHFRAFLTFVAVV